MRWYPKIPAAALPRDPRIATSMVNSGPLQPLVRPLRAPRGRHGGLISKLGSLISNTRKVVSRHECRRRASCATEATRAPSREKREPRAKPREFVLDTGSAVYRSQSDGSCGRWNQREWSRLPEPRCSNRVPGRTAAPIKPKSDRYVRTHERSRAVEMVPSRNRIQKGWRFDGRSITNCGSTGRTSNAALDRGRSRDVRKLGLSARGASMKLAVRVGFGRLKGGQHFEDGDAILHGAHLASRKGAPVAHFVDL